MKRHFIYLLFILPILVHAQTEYAKYDWNTLPAATGGDTIKAVDGAVILLERRITDIYVNKDGNFEETYVYHRKIRVETHEAVNSFNKIYIPLNNVLDIINVSARFISPDGKETVLPKSSIKQIDNLENQGNYKTFVIEGAETGGQIEYFYVLRKEFNPYGGYYVQDDTPRANVEVIFAYPKKLEYMFNSKNGFPEFVVDDSKEDRTTQRAFISYIPGISEEKYAYYKSNMMSFDFTLAFNRYLSSIRVYSWAKACDKFYNNLFVLTGKEKSAVAKLLNQIAVTGNDTETKIRQIENWVKQNFKIDKNLQGQANLSMNIKLKQCNFSDISKLFVALFDASSINFEYVRTGDKSEQPFEPNFDAYNYLDYAMFYFPEINKYLTPEDNAYRLGLMPDQFQGGYGLFMKPLNYENIIRTLSYEIKPIPSQPCTLNTDSLLINVTIDTDNKLLKTKTERVMEGDFARNFQSFMHLLDDVKRKELVESLFAMGSEQTEVLKLNYENSSPENIGVKPLVWNLELQSKSLIEDAGEDLLVKLGETIGQQSELYQEKQRKLPVTVGILHDYYRKITMPVPQGYKVENLNEFNMHVEMKTDNITSCIFTSEASLNGDVLTIISKEYYTEPSYPASRYEEFRKVINASADFNKKTLLLRKI